MKQQRIKGQALALVLIVVVISIIIAFSITNRVLQDMKQQTQERAATRAETLAETAVEDLTQRIQSGSLNSVLTGTSYVTFGVSNNAPAGSVDALDLCSRNSTDLSTQCDDQSRAQVNLYNMIIQFKLYSSESIETHLVPTSSATTKVGSGQSTIILHFNDDQNQTYDTNTSTILVKAYARTGSPADVKLVSECLISMNDLTGTCLPSGIITVAPVATCPTVNVAINPSANPPVTSQKELGTKCVALTTNGPGASFYRILPILKATDNATVPYTVLSVTGGGASAFNLPVPQMAMITAGVFTGGLSGSDQQVFQQSTRLILLNKSVPEIADYVLFNGSGNPVVKK